MKGGMVEKLWQYSQVRFASPGTTRISALRSRGAYLTETNKNQVDSFPNGRAHHAPMETVAPLLGNEVEPDRLRQKVEVQFVSYVTP